MSKDNFHVQIVPLFPKPEQTLVDGIGMKDDLKKLKEGYMDGIAIEDRTDDIRAASLG